MDCSFGLLSSSEQQRVIDAYERRCHVEGAIPEPDPIQGIKRVDYLLEKYVFCGLTRTGSSDGFENMHIILRAGPES